MATRSINLGGLPDIPSGGVDPDQLIKLATLLNQLDESKAKLGTPGTPPTTITGTPEVQASGGMPATGGVVSSSKPWYQGVPVIGGIAKLLGAPQATPISGLDQVPANASVDPATLDLLKGGGTAYAKGTTPPVPPTPYQPATPDVTIPGTPGTPGSTELATKAGIAHLLTPDSAAEQMNKYGYEGIKFATKKESKNIYYNAYTAEIATPQELAALPADEKRQYQEVTQERAVEEIGKFYRDKMKNKADTAVDLLRYHNDLVDLTFKTPEQKLHIQALEKVLPDILGIEGSRLFLEKQNKAQESAYKKDKADILSQIDTVKNSNLPRSEKATRINKAIEALKSKYSADIYDLKPKDESQLKSIPLF